MAIISNGTTIVTGGSLASGIGGKILQVQQSVKNDATSRASTSGWGDIAGMSVSLTPSSTSSKVLITACCNLGNNGGYAFVRLLRGSTVIGVGTNVGSRLAQTLGNESNSHGNGTETDSMTFLDSPSTTSATTYKLQWHTQGSTIRLNFSATDSDNANFPRGISTITAMEVAN
jgi:hypothetical protein